MGLCLFDPDQKTLHFSGSKTDLYILRNAELFKTKGTRKSVGTKAPQIPFETHSVALEEGDKIYMFTDGFENQFGGVTNKKLKRPALLDLLLETSNHDMDIQKEKLNSYFDLWKGKAKQTDDVCLIGIQI